MHSKFVMDRFRPNDLFLQTGTDIIANHPQTIHNCDFGNCDHRLAWLPDVPAISMIPGAAVYNWFVDEMQFEMEIYMES